MTQEEAFLVEARSDYAVFEHLLGLYPTVAECHVLHYFAMATEKLAKAFLAHSGSQVPTSHFTFHRICLDLRGQFGALSAIGYSNTSVIDHFLSQAEPLFRQIEDLQPTANTQHENVEYPWWQTHPTSGQDWLAPAEVAFAAFQIITATSGDGLTMMSLVRNLLSHWDKMP